MRRLEKFIPCKVIMYCLIESKATLNKRINRKVDNPSMAKEKSDFGIISSISFCENTATAILSVR